MKQQNLSDSNFNTKKCFFEATDEYSQGIQIAIFFIITVLGSIVVRNWYRYGQTIKVKLGSKYSFKLAIKHFQFGIYSLLTAWIIVTLCKTIVNIYAFEKFMRDIKNTNTSYPAMVTPAAWFYVADNYSAYIILTLLILIPNRWLTKALRSIPDERVEVQSRTPLSHLFKVLKLMKVYLLIRIIYGICLAGMLFMILYTENEALKIFNQLSAGIIISESILFILFYIFGYFCASFMRSRSFLTMNPQEQKVLKMEYSALLIVLIARCFLNGFFYFFTSNQYSYNPKPNCTDRAPHHVLIRCLFLIFGTLFMHLLPVCTVLYIYQPRKEEESGVRQESVSCSASLLNQSKAEGDPESF